MPSVQFGRVATQQVVIHLLLRLSSSAMCNGVAMQCVVMSVCVCMCCIARTRLDVPARDLKPLAELIKIDILRERCRRRYKHPPEL